MHPATESNSIFSYQMHNHLPALIVLYHLCVLSSWTLKSCFLFSCILVLLYSCFLVFTVFYFVVFSFTHRSVNKNLQRLQTNSRKIEWSNPALGFLRRLFTIVRCILVSCFTNACQSAKRSRFKWLRLFVVIIVFIKQDCLAIICNLPFSHLRG